MKYGTQDSGRAKADCIYKSTRSMPENAVQRKLI